MGWNSTSTTLGVNQHLGVTPKCMFQIHGGPIKGACAQSALGAAHGLNIPCHNSYSN